MRTAIIPILLALSITAAAIAQPASYFVDDPDSNRVRVYMPGKDLFSGGFAAQVTVDPSALSIRYDEVRFTIPTFSYSREQSFTLGFGQTANFTTTINLQPTTVSFYGRADGHALTADSGGIYVAANHYAYAPGTGDVTFSALFRGTYEIERDGSAVAAGDFSTAASALIFYGFAHRVQTSNYPLTLSFDSGFEFWIGLEDDLFATTIDDFDLFTGINTVTLKGEISPNPAVAFTPGTLAAVPEPSTWAAIAGSAALLVAVIRRRTFAGKH